MNTIKTEVKQMNPTRLERHLNSPKLQRIWDDLQEHADRASSYKSMARLFCDQGKYRQAAIILREGLQRMPDDRGLWENLARTLQVGGFPTAAVRAWKKVKNQFPDHYLAYEKLERHYVRSGQHRKAVSMYRRVEETADFKEKSLERIVFVCKEAMDVPGVIRGLKKLVKLSGVNYRRARDLGRFYFKADNFSLAARWLEKAFRLGEGDQDLRLNLALAYARQKKYDRAEFHLRKILAEKPISFAGLINLLEIKIEAGELDRARELLKKIDQLYVNNSRAHLSRGEIALLEERYDDAETALRSGIGQTPYYYRWELERGWRLLSRTLEARGEEKESLFAAGLADALRGAPDAYQAWIALAEEKIASRDLEIAGKTLAILEKMFPRNIRVIIDRSELDLLKGYPLKAVADLNASLEKTPPKFVRDKVRGYRVLSRAYKATGDWEGARNSLRQAESIESFIFTPSRRDGLEKK